jgi:hypothetical protein
MTWVMLSLLYSFGTQSSKIAAVLPQPQPSVAARVGVPGSAGPDVDFELVVNGTLWRWDTFALFLLPGEKRTFRVASADREGGFEWEAAGGSFTGDAARERIYTAPGEPGLYRAGVQRGRHRKSLNLFVMIPFRHQTTINGYRIGTYPQKSHFPKMGLPRGFIEVNAANVNTWLSPHFRLREFVCRQPAPFPKYVVLREGLIRKLEYLIGFARNQGVNCPGLHLISGYRTPFFNSANGNSENSVHTYGGAADIYVDADNDGRMDDLDRNGRRDVNDALFLYRLCERLEKQYPEFTGGDGYYPGNGSHGAFVHTDVRGQASRWHQ